MYHRILSLLRNYLPPPYDNISFYIILFLLIIALIKVRNYKRVLLLYCTGFCGLIAQALVFGKKPIYGAYVYIIFALGVFFISLFSSDISELPRSKPPLRAFLIFLFFLITILMIFMRVYRWRSYTHCLLVDETEFAGMRTLRYLHSEERKYLPIYEDRETVIMYLEILAIKIFGPSIESIRSVPIAAAIITAFLSFFIYRYLFGSKAALVGYFLMAVGMWSTIETRNFQIEITVSLTLAITILSWLIGMHTGNILSFAISGFLSIFGLTTWVPFRMTPLLIGSSIFHKLLFDRAFFRKRFIGLIVFLIFASLATYWILLPHFHYFFPDKTNPKQIFAYENPKARFMENLRKWAETFNYKMHPTTDIFRRDGPILNGFVGILFVAGLSICLANLRKHGYFLAFVWFFIFSIPGLLSEPNPRRIVGVLPIVYGIAGIALYHFAHHFSLLFKNGRGLVKLLLILAILLPVGSYNFKDIFKDSYGPPIMGKSERGTQLALFIKNIFPFHHIFQYMDVDACTLNFLTASVTGDINFFKQEENIITYFPVFLEEVNRDIAVIVDFSPLGDEILSLARQFYPDGRSEKLSYMEIPYGRIYYINRDDFLSRQGLRYEVYPHDQWDGEPITSGILPSPQFYSLRKDLSPLLINQSFNLKVSGSFVVREEGLYYFELSGPGGSKFIINGDEFSDSFFNGEIFMVKGKEYLKKGLNVVELRIPSRPDEQERFELKWAKEKEDLKAIPRNACFVEKIEKGLLAATRTKLIDKVLTVKPSFTFSFPQIPMDRVKVSDALLVDENTIFLNETYNLLVFQIDSRGTLIKQWQVEELKNNVLPAGWSIGFNLTATPDGRIIVADRWNAQIIELFRDGLKKRHPLIPRIEPGAIIANSLSELIFMTTSGAGKIPLNNQRSEAEWGCIPIVQGTHFQPLAIANDRNDNMFILDYKMGGILKLDPRYNQTGFMTVDTGKNLYLDMAIDHQGRIYILYQGGRKIDVLTSDGKLMVAMEEGKVGETIKVQGMDNLTAISFANDGKGIVVSEKGEIAFINSNW